jgi:hypothetical protein
MTDEFYQTMTTKGIDVENEAKIEFFASVGGTYGYNYNQQIHSQFTSQIREKHTTTLGGDVSITTIEQ